MSDDFDHDETAEGEELKTPLSEEDFEDVEGDELDEQPLDPFAPEEEESF